MTRDEILELARKMPADDHDEDADLEDTPDEKIIADFREAWKQVVRGDWTEYKTAHEMLADLDADDGSL